MNLTQEQIDEIVKKLLRLLENGVDVSEEIKKIEEKYEKGNVKWKH